MEKTIEFLQTKRGATKVLFDGREYHKRKTYTNGNKFWLCSKPDCKGSITTSSPVEDRQEMSSTTTHTVVKENPHKPDCHQNITQCHILKAFEELKNNVCSNYEPIQKQYEQVVCKLKDSGAHLVSDLPTFSSVKSGLYNARNKDLNVAKLHFQRPEDVVIPKKFHSFLLADYIDDVRLLIFGNPDKNMLNNFDIVLLDGTFKVCPLPFKQLYSIHGYNAITKTTVPLFFAFLQDKKEKSYQILFDILKTKFPFWKPPKMLVDFEKSAINAIQKLYPETRIKGCYYHLSKSLFKKAKQLGIKSRIQRRHVARCAGLARLPIKYISSGYTYAIQRSPKTDPITKFNTYFERYWLQDLNFIKIWCCEGEQIRSNNHLEGRHSRMNRFVCNKNPSIAKVLDVLVKETKIKSTNSAVKQRTNNNYHEIDREINATIEQLKNKEITVGHCLEVIAPFMI